MFAKGKPDDDSNGAAVSDAEAFDIFVRAFCRQRTAHAEMYAKRLGCDPDALREHEFSQRTPHMTYKELSLDVIAAEDSASYSSVCAEVERTFTWLREKQERLYARLAKGAYDG